MRHRDCFTLRVRDDRVGVAVTVLPWENTLDFINGTDYIEFRYKGTSKNCLFNALVGLKS